MTKLAFAALGDIHLADTIWRSRPDVTGDAVLGLKNLYEVAKHNGVPAVIVGDLFDTAEQRDPGCLVQFLRLTDEMQSLGIPVYAIQGNHDKRPVPWYAAHEWVTHIGDGKPVMINGVKSCGFDFDITDRIHDRIKSCPEVDCLFLHQAVKQALKFEGAWNCDLELVPDFVKLIVMGDIHTEWSKRMSDTQVALYTGSGHPRSHPEFGDRSVVLVSQDLTFKRVGVSTRPMRAFVWGEKAPDDILKWLEEALLAGVPVPLPHFVHVTHTDYQVPEINALKLKCAEAGKTVLWGSSEIPTISKTETATNSGEESSEIPTPAEIMSKRVKDSQALSLALDLVSSQVPLADTLLAHRTNFFKAKNA